MMEWLALLPLLILARLAMPIRWTVVARDVILMGDECGTRLLCVAVYIAGTDRPHGT